MALWDFVCDVCAAFAFLVDTDFRPTPSLSSFRSTPNVVIFEFECEAMFPDPESLSPCGITMKFPLFWEHTSSIGHLLSYYLVLGSTMQHRGSCSYELKEVQVGDRSINLAAEKEPLFVNVAERLTGN